MFPLHLYSYPQPQVTPPANYTNPYYLPPTQNTNWSDSEANDNSDDGCSSHGENDLPNYPVVTGKIINKGKWTKQEVSNVVTGCIHFPQFAISVG